MSASMNEKHTVWASCSSVAPESSGERGKMWQVAWVSLYLGLALPEFENVAFIAGQSVFE